MTRINTSSTNGIIPSDYYTYYNHNSSGIAFGLQTAVYFGETEKIYVRSKNDANSTWKPWREIKTEKLGGISFIGVALNSNISIPALTDTLVKMDHVVIDAGNNCDPLTSLFTVPTGEAGIYLVLVAVSFSWHGISY